MSRGGARRRTRGKGSEGKLDKWKNGRVLKGRKKKRVGVIDHVGEDEVNEGKIQNREKKQEVGYEGKEEEQGGRR